MHRSFSSSIGPILTLLAVACSTDRDIAGPDPEPTEPPAGLLGSAIRLHVDLRGGRVTVSQPSVVEATTKGKGMKPAFALLGRNEIDAEVTKVSRSAVGKFTPNRVRVTLSLALTNRLRNSDLRPSTFPTPPVEQVVAFPFATVPAGLFGLKVRASPQWDGAAHNFFNDGLCLGLPTPPADCFRWEPFGPGLEAGATTEAREVGFDIDPAIDDFIVYVVVAADIVDRALTGNIAGTIISNLFGPLAGALVTAGPGGQTGTSDEDGAYLVQGLPSGPATVKVSGTPTSCFQAPSASLEVEGGVTTRRDFDLRCRRIVFASDRDGNLEIYTMNADGSEQHRITNHAAGDFTPSWSPDGSRIVFASNRDEPAAGNNRGEIYIMNADGSGLVRLTNNNVLDGHPAWSPDGSKIAFVSTRDGEPGNPEVLPDWEIYVMNVDGTNPIRLTANRVLDLRPAWSPDGRKLAFESDREDSRGSLNADIYVIDAEGGTPTRLTTDEAIDADPQWSPDGSKLVFSSSREFNFDLYVMNADGSNQTRLTSHSARDMQPTWSPDGSKLGFVSVRDGTAGVYLMDAGGGEPTQLTPLGGITPSW